MELLSLHSTLPMCLPSPRRHSSSKTTGYGTLQEALNYSDGLAVLGVWLRESSSDPESISDLMSARADKHLGGAVGWRGEEPYHYSEEEHAAAAYYWFTNLSPSSATVQDAHVHVHLRQLLPLDDSVFYRYEGSLTTPPCTENVMWTVFQDSLVLPRPLLQGLRKLTTPIPPENVDHTLSDNDIAHSLSNNFRPTQPLGSRTVYFSGNMAQRATSCTSPKRSRTSCLEFLDVVMLPASTEVDSCQRRPLNLHLRDAQVVVSPTLTWKRLGTCRTVSVVNDGHILRVRYSRRSPQWQLTGSNLRVPYYLGEMVLRLGSKHLLGGLRFPLEIQLIHYNAKYKDLQEAMTEPDGVVVVVKFFQEPISAWEGSKSNQLFSGHNKNLHNILEAIEEEEKGEDVRAKSPDIRYLMDSTSSYYEYHGPLPGTLCNTSVIWLIIRKSSHVSRDQLGSLDDLLEENLFTAHALEPRVPPVLLLRVGSPQMATEYRSILRVTPKEYVTSAVTNAASTLQSAGGVYCYSLSPSKLLLAMPLITIAVLGL
ncbi:uncharacterized protein LOC127006012 isoform X2 [Eriocheir sinensis]|uniref:uncharacterized protein LOC127006012 isoform X2 n=1 Tax=Eriocheir sinensis TaxID=95602 RepID=UPI0021C5BBD0|nr:uncharacterized protein LOC127006012 isoform X2 [Eriocheir sinensis]